MDLQCDGLFTKSHRPRNSGVTSTVFCLHVIFVYCDLLSS